MRLPKLLRFYKTFLELRRAARRAKNKIKSIEFSAEVVAAAYVAFAIKFTKPLALPLWKEEGYTANFILANKLQIPEAFVNLILNVALRNQKEVKRNLIDLISNKCFHHNTPEETITRGFISLATGEVDSIEDLAQAVNFDADVAEGLSFVASSATSFIPLSRFLTSSSLNKVFTRCGLSLKVMAALLAIVNQDYKHGDEITNSLSLIKINGRYLRAMMAVYRDENQKSKKDKREAIRQSIQPLALLYKMRDIEVVTSVIRMVQGDVNVVRSFIKERLKWSKGMAEAAAAFILLSQAHVIPLDFSPSAYGQWDEIRHAKTACRIAAKALTRYRFTGIDRDSLLFILNATLPESDNGDALAKVTEEVKGEVNKDNMDEVLELLLNMFEMDEEDDDDDEDDNGKEEEGNSDDNSEDDDDDDGKGDTETDAETDAEESEDKGLGFNDILKIIVNGRYKRVGENSIEEKLRDLNKDDNTKALLNALKKYVNKGMKYIDLVNILRLIVNGDYAFRRKQNFDKITETMIDKAKDKAEKEHKTFNLEVFKKKALQEAMEEARIYVQLQFIVSVASGSADKVLEVQGNHLCKCGSGKKSKNCCAPCTCGSGEKFKECCGPCICGLIKEGDDKGTRTHEDPSNECCRVKCTCDDGEEFENCCASCHCVEFRDSSGKRVHNKRGKCSFSVCDGCDSEKAFKRVVLYVLVVLSRKGRIKVKERTIDKAKIVVLNK